MRGRTPTPEEAKRLMRRWDRATFPTISAAIRYHARKHGFDVDVWTYLRRAAAFRNRSARKAALPDGAVRYRRSNGEFLIERRHKIISYGINRV
jgi:hypothetical protein